MSPQTNFLVKQNNQHAILNALYKSFRESYRKHRLNNWHFKSHEKQNEFINEVVIELKANWATDLSKITPQYDNDGNLVEFDSFQIEVIYFDTSGDEREAKNEFLLTCSTK